MAKRKQITIFYDISDNWIGGAYYVLNIIRALKTLPDPDKPEVSLLYPSTNKIDDVVKAEYPYISFYPLNLQLSRFKLFINRCSRKVLSKDLFKIRVNYQGLDNLYPSSLSIDTKNFDNHVFWIPDLQEYFLPEFFTRSELRLRRYFIKTVVRSGRPIVFSSTTSLRYFRRIYPNSPNKLIVLPFVSIIDKRFEDISFPYVKDKYQIDVPYFMSPNQFWAHKNHKVVLDAILILKKLNLKFQVVFTGREYDYRAPQYFALLKSLVIKYEIQDYVRFLGFIDRDEQLLLMKNSLCIIQPSLFEGWSTVVEDVKAIKQYIVVSDIEIHREQIANNCTFFNPRSAADLADVLADKLRNGCLLEKSETDYDQCITAFARGIVSLLM